MEVAVLDVLVPEDPLDRTERLSDWIWVGGGDRGQRAREQGAHQDGDDSLSHGRSISGLRQGDKAGVSWGRIVMPGAVEQAGVLATLSRWRSGVQIPSAPQDPAR